MRNNFIKLIIIFILSFIIYILYSRTNEGFFFTTTDPMTTQPTTTGALVSTTTRAILPTTTGARGAEALVTTTTGARGAEALVTTTTGARGAEALVTEALGSIGSLMDKSVLDVKALIKDIQTIVPDISSSQSVDLVNSGLNINNLVPTLSNSYDTLTFNGYSYPSTNVYQTDFNGTNNFSPYLFFNKNSSENFDSLKNI